MDDLHRPGQLRDDILVGQGSHVGVRPCVHGNIILNVVDGAEELSPVVEDIDTNKEVGGVDVVLFEEIEKAI